MLSEADYFTGLHLIHQQEGDKRVRKTSSPVVLSVLVCLLSSDFVFHLMKLNVTSSIFKTLLFN